MQVVQISPRTSVHHSLMEISVWIVLICLENIAKKHVVFVEVCITDANILPLYMYFLIAFFSFYLCKQIFTGYLFSYLSFISLLQRVALIVRLCAQIFQTTFVPLISTGPGKIVDGRVVSVQVNILHLFFFSFLFFFSSLVQFKFILAPRLRITIIMK